MDNTTALIEGHSRDYWGNLYQNITDCYFLAYNDEKEHLYKGLPNAEQQAYTDIMYQFVSDRLLSRFTECKKLQRCSLPIFGSFFEAFEACHLPGISKISSNYQTCVSNLKDRAVAYFNDEVVCAQVGEKQLEAADDESLGKVISMTSCVPFYRAFQKDIAQYAKAYEKSVATFVPIDPEAQVISPKVIPTDTLNSDKEFLQTSLNLTLFALTVIAVAGTAFYVINKYYQYHKVRKTLDSISSSTIV